MQLNFNIYILIFTQIAILVLFNVMNEVEWWMNLLLMIPLIVLGVHTLLKKFVGKGLFFLEKTNYAQNYVNVPNVNQNKTITQMNAASNKLNTALESVNTAANNLANAAANNVANTGGNNGAM